MSALPPKADIGTQSRDVRFVPKADIADRPQQYWQTFASVPAMSAFGAKVDIGRLG